MFMSEIKSIYDLVEDGTLSIEMVLRMARVLYPEHKWLKDSARGSLSKGYEVFRVYDSGTFFVRVEFDPIARPEQQLAVRDWLVNNHCEVSNSAHVDWRDEDTMLEPRHMDTLIRGYTALGLLQPKVSSFQLNVSYPLTMAAALEGE